MEHYYESIYGWFSPNDKRIYDKAVDLFDSGDVFVEVGSYKGRSTTAMAVNIINSGKQIKFYAIDTWKGSDEEVHRNDPDIIADNLYNVFQKNTSVVKDYIIPMQCESTIAAQSFEDHSISFLFLDAAHDYENVIKDLNAWYKKVKTDGLLCGHDWTWETVRNAVIDFCNLHNLNVSYDDNVWTIKI